MRRLRVVFRAEAEFDLLQIYRWVYEASRDDGASPRDGQRRQLDATQQVRAQAATLRPFDALVRLVPVDRDRDLQAVGLSVDRLTLEFV